MTSAAAVHHLRHTARMDVSGEALDIIDDDLPYGWHVVDMVDGVAIVDCADDMDED